MLHWKRTSTPQPSSCRSMCGNIYVFSLVNICTFNLSGTADLNPMVSMWAFHCSSHDCLLVGFSNKFGWISMFPPSMDPVIGLFCGKSPFLNEKHVILPCFMGNENYSNWWKLGPNPGSSGSKKSPPVRSPMFDDTSITEPQQESLVIICPGSIHIPMIGWKLWSYTQSMLGRWSVHPCNMYIYILYVYSIYINVPYHLHIIH